MEMFCVWRKVCATDSRGPLHHHVVSSGGKYRKYIYIQLFVSERTEFRVLAVHSA